MEPAPSTTKPDSPSLNLKHLSGSRLGLGVSQSSMDSMDDEIAQQSAEPNNNDPSALPASGNSQKARKQFRHRTKSITGETIYKDHPSHDIMLNIKLGVRHTVGRASARETRELTLQDFQYEPKTFFPSRGTPETPPHKSTDFKFKDYSPLAFKHIRSRFGIDEAEYMLSIGGDGALKEVPTPGKSGALFYKTRDDRFLIKTITKAETKYFRHILPQYYNHVMQHHDTFLPRFFQLFRIKTKRGANIRMVVMHNILPSHLNITERYDIKGSTFGRRTPEEVRSKPTVTLKDLDFTEMGKRLIIGPDPKRLLMRQLQIDASFLATAKLMDYSLLVGVKVLTPDMLTERLTAQQHNLAASNPRQSQQSVHNTFAFSHNTPTNPNNSHSLAAPSAVSSVASSSSTTPTSSSSATTWNNSDTTQTTTTTSTQTSALSNILTDFPQQQQQQQQRSHMSQHQSLTPRQRHHSELYAFDGALECMNENGQPILVYCGIIDILQEYDVRKQIEHIYKGARFDKHTISAVAPENYAMRFVDYLKSRVFF